MVKDGKGGKGPEILARDMLIIWEAAAKGITSARVIQNTFVEKYEGGERETPHPDTIRKWTGRYQDFLRFLPEYPHPAPFLLPIERYGRRRRRHKL